MNTVMKNLVGLGLIVVSGSSIADNYSAKPYLGIDFYKAWMRGKNTEDFGKNHLPKSYPGPSVYAGMQWMKYFGTEFGTEWSSSRTMNSSIIENNIQYAITNTVRRRGVHFDLVGFLPLNDHSNLLATAGAGWIKATIGNSVTDPNGVSVESRSVGSKTRAFPRLGVGANYLLTEMFGLRTKINYENTSTLRINDNGKIIKPFKNSVSFTAGVFAQF